MTTDKTHKGFEEFSMELAKHPEIYKAFGWEDMSADLKDLNAGKITSSSFAEKYVDTCGQIFCDTEEFFSMQMIPEPSPSFGGGGWFEIYELLGFYWSSMGIDGGGAGPFKKFDDAVANILGEIIENGIIEEDHGKNRFEIKYTKNFERYFDSHIKLIILACCPNTISGSIDVNDVAYREVNGEVKASS